MGGGAEGRQWELGAISAALFGCERGMGELLFSNGREGRGGWCAWGILLAILVLVQNSQDSPACCEQRTRHGPFCRDPRDPLETRVDQLVPVQQRRHTTPKHTTHSWHAHHPRPARRAAASSQPPPAVATQPRPAVRRGARSRTLAANKTDNPLAARGTRLQKRPPGARRVRPSTTAPNKEKMRSCRLPVVRCETTPTPTNNSATLLATTTECEEGLGMTPTRHGAPQQTQQQTHARASVPHYPSLPPPPSLTASRSAQRP